LVPRDEPDTRVTASPGEPSVRPVRRLTRRGRPGRAPHQTALISRRADTSSLRGLRLARPYGAPDEGAWLLLYVAARLAATLIAAALVAWGGLDGLDTLLLLYGPASTALLASSDRLRRHPAVWALDFGACLVLVLLSGDWRSPFYLMWLASLALPATALSLRRSAGLAAGAALAYLLVAVVGGPVPGRLQLISSETLAIHVSLPFLLVCALAYAAEALRRLAAERTERERLAIEAERRRIAWELHDSAKQRLHATHLLVSSLLGRVPTETAPLVERAAIELESAAAEMDTSLAELHSPLEGRRLDEALRRRAAELVPGGVRVQVTGRAPELPPLVGAHLYRIGCEAITNALRHADATTVEVALHDGAGAFRLAVRDDGRGLPSQPRPGAHGLAAMESRAATIGARLRVGAAPGGGTLVDLELPMNPNGGHP
jgi:signal transduction histidine kinase